MSRKILRAISSCMTLLYQKTKHCIKVTIYILIWCFSVPQYLDSLILFPCVTRHTNFGFQIHSHLQIILPQIPLFFVRSLVKLLGRLSVTWFCLHLCYCVRFWISFMEADFIFIIFIYLFITIFQKSQHINELTCT